MQSCIILPGDSDEEKERIVDTLYERFSGIKKVKDAFSRLFGTQLPHTQIERLARQNSRAMNTSYNEQIFRVLFSNPATSFYDDEEYPIWHELRHASDWEDGRLIVRWQRYTQKPNPHHIVPKSRGGTENKNNFWYVDRITHNDFHTVFQNLTPTEQITLLLKIYGDTFSTTFLQMLINLNSAYSDEQLYKKGVVSRSYNSL